MAAIIENVNINLNIAITGLSAANLQGLANSIQTAVAGLKSTYPTTTIEATMKVDVPVNVN